MANSKDAATAPGQKTGESRDSEKKQPGGHNDAKGGKGREEKTKATGSKPPKSENKTVPKPPKASASSKDLPATSNSNDTVKLPAPQLNKIPKKVPVIADSDEDDADSSWDYQSPMGYPGMYAPCGPPSMAYWGPPPPPPPGAAFFDHDDPQNHPLAVVISDSDSDSPHGDTDGDDDDDMDVGPPPARPEEGVQDLWQQFRDRYADEDGPEIQEDIAASINAMWKKGRDKVKLKELYTKYPRPSNVCTQKTDINDEVLQSIPKGAKSVDMKLRSVQTGISKTAVTMVTSIKRLMNYSEPVKRQPVVDVALDAITILGSTNAYLNQVRRDLLKPHIHPKYQELCKPKASVDTSQWLFGTDVSERIKKQTQGGKISKKRGRGGRYNPYIPYQAYQAQFGKYSRGAARSRGAFLGKPYTDFTFDKQNMNAYNVAGSQSMNESIMKCHVQMQSSEIHDQALLQANKCHDISTQNMYIGCFRPQRGPQRQRAPGQQYQDKVTDSPDENEEDTSQVGEYNTLQIHPIMTESKWPVYKAGRVSTCTEKWANLTSDYKILTQLRGYVLEFEDGEIPFQTKIPKEINFNHTERIFLRNEIDNLIGKLVLKEVTHIPGEYISNVFLRSKKQEGKFRMILNLKKLNENVEKHHFKMDTLMSILALVKPGCYFLSLDFSDAYYSLAIALHHRKYLRFQFEGHLYEFTCMPNGVSCAPRFFTKILKIPLSHMRELGYTIAGYLDDQILMADTINESLEAGQYAAKLFEDLGFTINLEKSVLIPTQSIEHLGFIINSKTMRVTMTEHKSQKILDKISQCIQPQTLSIREVASLLGQLNATKPANPWAYLFTKNMEIDKNWALKTNKYDFEATMTLSENTKTDLQWWTRNLSTLSGPITQPKPSYVMFTDASLEGWGCHDPESGISSGGRWDLEEQKHHINYLELKAIWLSLKSLCKQMTHKHVRIMSDNTTAVACINKQGSTQSSNCNKMARHIWDFGLQRDLWLSAAHCPGVLNTEADAASRKFQDETEWALDPDIFHLLCREFGEPTIDLFASRLNHKTPRYCAWQPDPDAIFIDSLMYDWGGEQMVYAFPPFAIVHLVLQKFISDQAEGILIVPFWTTQPWFTQFADLVISNPIIIPVTDKSLFLPFRVKTHPLKDRLFLLAAHCSTNLWKLREFRLQQSLQSSKAGENHQQHYTSPTYRCGNCIVSRGVSIQLKPL